ncbi:RICIN domain-containing protein [Bacillus gaemokensis]|uniref:Toxin n=1 Tax=Bacillus gaemokensis TaxID=574375 RepID=A0A073JZ66_9BACI|nr:RICIN domain-containing protein [Bacillus gaemokensis]KEK20349.1 toxin [Bacillus gaemokensis]KYG29188.1 toxin [Bacillus gaemokensis]
MKLVSKKVMTGLLVGALSLSIWTPASAAVPEKNRYYTIDLAANRSLVWDVARESVDNDSAILLYKGANHDNQQFAFFPLDDGKYAIVNKHSGKPVTIASSAWVGNGLLRGTELLRQQSWTGASAEQWYLRDQGNNKYEIVNQGYGKVASYARQGDAIQKVEYVDLDNTQPSDQDRVFYITNSPSGFSLPKLPATGTRPTAPDYTEGPYQQLPQTSNSVVIGASLVPSIMVNDGLTSDYTKIHNSPYYTLVKEEYWDKTYSTVIQSGVTQSFAFKTGMSSTDQQKMTDTLSMQVGADLGLKFGDQTATIKAQITRTLQTEVSTSSTQIAEDTVTTSVTGEAGKTSGHTQYQLATKYTLYRQDGTAVSNPWIVKNNKITVARKSSI